MEMSRVAFVCVYGNRIETHLYLYMCILCFTYYVYYIGTLSEICRCMGGKVQGGSICSLMYGYLSVYE